MWDLWTSLQWGDVCARSSAGSRPDWVGTGKRSPWDYRAEKAQEAEEGLTCPWISPSFASVGHRIQGSGPVSCSGNTAVLEMLKREEIQEWEFPFNHHDI